MITLGLFVAVFALISCLLLWLPEVCRGGPLAATKQACLCTSRLAAKVSQSVTGSNGAGGGEDAIAIERRRSSVIGGDQSPSRQQQLAMMRASPRLAPLGKSLLYADTPAPVADSFQLEDGKNQDGEWSAL